MQCKEFPFIVVKPEIGASNLLNLRSIQRYYPVIDRQTSKTSPAP
jgi:hypothetical protein